MHISPEHHLTNEFSSRPPFAASGAVDLDDETPPSYLLRSALDHDLSAPGEADLLE
ncbi:hypothetical protein [Subtercola sp. YIM 133946]|uniref:hypothetical protein n=1 Tax=Subtercola sp. YIM 133946 TaxID=3118909 RepID=UPI002F9558D1